MTGWTPYTIMLMWQVYDRHSLNVCVPEWFRYLLYIFAVGNSVINPFVHSHHIFFDCLKRYRKRRLESKSTACSSRPMINPVGLTATNDTCGTVSNEANQVSPTHL